MFKNIVASGCSFTSDGIGGHPPTSTNPNGGCSFALDADYKSAEPTTWAGVVAQKLSVKSFVNVAAASHGNFLIANNILSLINRFDYRPTDTLILFNLSDPARLDVICQWDDKTKSEYCDWPKDVLPFAYLNRNSELVKRTLLGMGIDQVENFSSNAILGMMSFLKQENFCFYFTMMRDYRTNMYLGPVIEKFKDHLVELDPGVGMYEYASASNALRPDRAHPTTAGHTLIAEQLLNILNKYDD